MDEEQYLWLWLDRSHQPAVLKVRGELDAVTADRFAVEAVRLLKQARGPVAVDLSILNFTDCAGARMLAAVLRAIPSSQLAGVSGIQPPVKRVFDVIGLDFSSRIPAHPPARALALPLRGQDLIARAQAAHGQSRETMLETSAVMARLAATYSEMAAARERRGAHEHEKAQSIQALSDTARNLSISYRQRAMASADQPA